MRFFRWGTVGLLLVGAIAGVIFWGGFNTFMEATNTLEFCISCHEMKSTVYVEYQKSPHYRNASGVRATCPDCHVPKEWGPKLMRKIQATNELFHHFRGTIDTPEKFEAQRAVMAERVWAKMKSNDSHECRNCHSWEAMDFHKQTPRAREKMEEGRKEGKTCIECHQGIAHALPKRDD
jgi:nitrate/TMAO reductase-like tetraheme cytochrome c subunit